MATILVVDDSNLSRNCDVAIDAAGNFHVVWEDPDSKNAFYKKRNADGTYGSRVTLDATSGRSYYPAIAIAPNGYIHVAWHDDNNDGVKQAGESSFGAGIRVELCWAPMPTDVDLHVARLQNATKCTHGWFDTCFFGEEGDDCYFGNECSGGFSTSIR